MDVDNLENAKTAKEAIELFDVDFQEQKNKLKRILDSSNSLPTSDLPQHFDSITIEIQKMHKYLSDSVGFLRPYDIRVCQEAMKTFQDELDTKQAELLPKKKFAFKGAKKKTQFDRVKPDEVDGSMKYKPVEKVICGFEDMKDLELTKNENEVNDKDVGLHRLTNCVVKVSGSPNTLHVTGLRGCRVLVGPVKTSIFMEDCRDCVFELSCQQLRLHTSVDSDFYLFITSNPIIEDCTRIRVAPRGGDVELGGVGKVNKWNLVNDFNWLAADMPSPNWKVIPEEERIKELF